MSEPTIRFPFGTKMPFEVEEIEALKGKVAEMEAALAKFGGAADYSQFEADGTLKMAGEATVYLDSMVPPTVFRTGGTALTLAELHDGIYAHRFDTGVSPDTIHFNLQFNHGIKKGADVCAHVHLVNKDAIVGAADVKFNLKYSWANIGKSFPDLGDPLEEVVSFADAPALTHKVLDLGTITPTADQSGISSIIIGALSRVNDGYTTANIFLLGFDIHYENDTIGSREEYVK